MPRALIAWIREADRFCDAGVLALPQREWMGISG